MIIYKLTSSQTDQVYVGKCKSLKDRFKSHKCDYKSWLEGRRDFRSSYFLTEYDDVKIELIEETKNSLREIYWIQKLNTVNYDNNGDDYFICKVKDKNCKLGFLYRFEIKRNKKRIIEKKSTDKQFILKYRDEWIKNNPQVFME